MVGPAAYGNHPDVAGSTLCLRPMERRVNPAPSPVRIFPPKSTDKKENYMELDIKDKQDPDGTGEPRAESVPTSPQPSKAIVAEPKGAVEDQATPEGITTGPANLETGGQETTEAEGPHRAAAATGSGTTPPFTFKGKRGSPTQKRRRGLGYSPESCNDPKRKAMEEEAEIVTDPLKAVRKKARLFKDYCVRLQKQGRISHAHVLALEQKFQEVVKMVGAPGEASTPTGSRKGEGGRAREVVQTLTPNPNSAATQSPGKQGNTPAEESSPKVGREKKNSTTTGPSVVVDYGIVCSAVAETMMTPGFLIAMAKEVARMYTAQHDAEPGQCGERVGQWARAVRKPEAQGVTPGPRWPALNRTSGKETAQGPGAEAAAPRRAGTTPNPAGRSGRPVGMATKGRKAVPARTEVSGKPREKRAVVEKTPQTPSQTRTLAGSQKANKGHTSPSGPVKMGAVSTPTSTEGIATATGGCPEAGDGFRKVTGRKGRRKQAKEAKKATLTRQVVMSMVDRKAASTRKPRQDTVTVKVKGDVVGPEERQKRLMEALDSLATPEALGSSIVGVRPIGAGELIFTVTGKEGVDYISRQAADLGLEYSVARPRLPRVVITGVPCNWDGVRLRQELIDCGRIDSGSIFRALFKRGRREMPLSQWVVETNRRNALVSENICIRGWLRLKAFDFVDQPRCLRCQGFGHLAVRCPARDSTCGYCGELKHGYRECPIRIAKKPPRCINCRQIGAPHTHDTGFNGCTAYLRFIQRKARVTEYGKSP